MPLRVRGEPVGIHAFGLKLSDAFHREVVEEARGWGSWETFRCREFQGHSIEFAFLPAERDSQQQNRSTKSSSACTVRALGTPGLIRLFRTEKLLHLIFTGLTGAHFQEVYLGARHGNSCSLPTVWQGMGT